MLRFARPFVAGYWSRWAGTVCASHVTSNPSYVHHLFVCALRLSVPLVCVPPVRLLSLGGWAHCKHAKAQSHTPGHSTPSHSASRPRPPTRRSPKFADLFPKHLSPAYYATQPHRLQGLGSVSSLAGVCACAHTRLCVRACVRVHVRVCVHVCVCVVRAITAHHTMQAVDTLRSRRGRDKRS